MQCRRPRYGSEVGYETSVAQHFRVDAGAIGVERLVQRTTFGRVMQSGSNMLRYRHRPAVLHSPGFNRMRIAFILCAGLSASSAWAQTAKIDFLVPPSDARHFTLLSSSARHGETVVWKDAHGDRCSRESVNVRGFKTETDQCATLAPDGTITRLTIRGFTPSGDEGEIFSADAHGASWHSPVDRGTATAPGQGMYSAAGGTFDNFAILFDRLMAAPGHTAKLLPSGQATLEKLADITVGGAKTPRHLTAYTISGLYFEPLPILADENGKFFGAVGPGLSLLPKGEEGDLGELLAKQTEALAQRSPALAHRMLLPATGPVAFTHVQIFDAEHHLFRRDMTVTTANGVITGIARAADTPPESVKGMRVVDGTGDTLLPGLWDMHQHYYDDLTGPLLLSLGITSARDPGNDNARTLDRARRRAQGVLLSPNVYPSALLDGKSPTTAQLGTAVGSLDEAIAAVRQARIDGFTAIKIYGSFHPDWVAATAAEAHRLGLHVHGHIPAGMRPLDAVLAGYDEVTHINFVLMQAMPADVVAKSNTDARMVGIGKFGGDVDLDAAPMAKLVDVLAARHGTVDPTLATFEGELVPDQGDMPAAYAPYIGTLPPVVERSFRGGGTAVPAGATRAQFRRSFAKLSALVEDLHAHGVRLVAGTDGSGLELPRELELYVAAGLSTSDALEAATLDAARDVGAADRTGSIDVGKIADLVLVKGDPSVNIGDVRHTVYVMLAGQLMDADALRSEAGISGRPK